MRRRVTTATPAMLDFRPLAMGGIRGHDVRKKQSQYGLPGAWWRCGAICARLPPRAWDVARGGVRLEKRLKLTLHESMGLFARREAFRCSYCGPLRLALPCAGNGLTPAGYQFGRVVYRLVLGVDVVHEQGDAKG
jgi:hypothetical protein